MSGLNSLWLSDKGGCVTDIDCDECEWHRRMGDKNKAPHYIFMREHSKRLNRLRSVMTMRQFIKHCAMVEEMHKRELVPK